MVFEDAEEDGHEGVQQVLSSPPYPSSVDDFVIAVLVRNCVRTSSELRTLRLNRVKRRSQVLSQAPALPLSKLLYQNYRFFGPKNVILLFPPWLSP